ncbi:MAG: right-handed parallel beta-helix repeat-containing protein, partial [Candidatus Cloacimonetes bacterium]|nr:right-handed parallel beta-helix repeat-containing protein [Candidatus Cloacimonadota bacterium]
RRNVGDEWYGLQFNTGSAGTLQYCTIEYATYLTAYGVYCNNSNPSIENCIVQNNDHGIYFTGVTSPTLSVPNTIQNNNNEGLYFTNCTNPSISNQTITGHSDPEGAIYMYNTGEFHIGDGNTITGNSWGLSMSIGSYPSSSSDGNIPTTGNTNDDGIQVCGGNTTESITWHDVSEDFIITQHPRISAGGTLTIEDNVNVKFENGQYINVYSSLNANGTAGNGILFTKRDTDDEWSGLQFQTGSDGTLQYCTIEYATYYTAYGVYCNNSTPTIENCIIQNNDHGIYFTGATSPTLSVSNTIQNNNNEGLYFTNCTNPSISHQTITGHSDPEGAIYMYNTGEFHIGDGNTINGNSWGLSMNIGSYPSSSSNGNIPTTGNTNDDGIQVCGGNTTESVTWHDVSEDFIITQHPRISAGGTLTIEDNVNVKFEHGKYLQIYGILNANGTAGNGILFTKRDTDDEWYGLQFQTGSDGTLQYCTIEHATYYSGNAVSANNPTSLSFDHCILQNNDRGFYGSNASPDFISNNEIINNNQYGIYLTGACEPTFGSGLAEWNDIYGNGTYDLYNGTSDITASYIYWGTTVQAEIDANIYDENDNGSLGLVTFIPYTNEAHDTIFHGDINAPENLVISVVADSVHLSWDAVPEATSYKIYSSDDPYAADWGTAIATGITETSWTSNITGMEKKFYYVTADNTPPAVMLNKGNRSTKLIPIPLRMKVSKQQKGQGQD